LCRDLNAGSHVRSITVQPTYLDDFFNDYYTRNTATEPCTPSLPRRLSNLPILRHLPCFFFGLGDHINVQNTQSLDPFEHLSNALVDVLPCFSYVTECEARWGSAPCNFHSVLVMAQIWTSLGNNLSTLEWVSLLETLHLLLLQTPSIHFPVLRNLYLRLNSHASQSCADSELFQISLAPFLNRHCSTIQTLSILRVNTLPPIDATALLVIVGQFPHLQNLSLSFGVVTGRYIQMSSPLALARLLDDNATTLKRISVTLSDVTANHLNYFQEELGDTLRTVFPARLSNLVRLRIYYGSSHGAMPMVKSAIMEVAHRYTDTLTSLVLNTCSNLTYEEVGSLVASFSHRPADERLDTLLVVVDVLSPGLLDLLISTLPGLTNLTLRFRQIRPHEVNSLLDRIGSSSRFHFVPGRMPSPGAPGTLFMHK
jgi:hypothetical protein